MSDLEGVPDDPRPAVDASAFHTAMAHLYRGEMHRMTVWRQRLDVTTNWAILLTGGLATFTLGSKDVPHFILLLGLALMAVSLIIESRRYRHLHHSNWRLQVLEACYFSSILEGRVECSGDGWREVLALDLRAPRRMIGWFTAIKVRLRRNYLLLFFFITAVWVAKLFIHPHDAGDFSEFWTRLAVGRLVPSWLVAVTASSFVAGLTFLAVTATSAEALEERARADDLRAEVHAQPH
jgi:uncharacterized membrane protein